MTVTGIAADNAEYFEGLAYEGAFEREDILWLGAADGDGTACTILGAGIYGEMAYIEWIYTEPS
ncbi:MAG: hypothetical protein K6F35_07305 [Lachnospiraceae bacterium]|nr:hypothetical protein [Lachnospiraceae bacterium]